MNPFIHTTHDGVKYALNNTIDLISASIISDGVFEKNNIDFSSKILDKCENGIVIDVGANLGSYTIPLAKKYSNFNFYCFEVQRLVYLQLCANVFLNGLQNVFVHHVAMSNENNVKSIKTLDVSNTTNAGGCSISDVARNLRQDNESLYSQVDLIQYRSLDYFNYDNVRLIKIDVEGMERTVLEGAINTINRNNQPPLMFEVWSGDWFRSESKKVFELLSYLNYNHVVQVQFDDYIAFQDQDQAHYFLANE